MKGKGINLVIVIGIILGAITLFRALIPGNMPISELPADMVVSTVIGVIGIMLLLAGIGCLFSIISKFIFTRPATTSPRRAWISSLVLGVGMPALGFLMSLYYWRWLVSQGGT